MYQFILSSQQIGINMSKDNNGNLTGHLLEIIERNSILMNKGINPCWVFDGKPPSAKKRTIEERKNSEILYNDVPKLSQSREQERSPFFMYKLLLFS